jgi:hypothetical protein
MYAAWGKHREIVDLILRHGGDPSISNEQGLNAAELAEERDARSIAHRLTQAAAKSRLSTKRQQAAAD